MTPERLKMWPHVCQRLDLASAELVQVKRKCPAMRALRLAGQRWPWAAKLAERLEKR